MKWTTIGKKKIYELKIRVPESCVGKIKEIGLYYSEQPSDSSTLVAYFYQAPVRHEGEGDELVLQLMLPFSEEGEENFNYSDSLISTQTTADLNPTVLAEATSVRCFVRDEANRCLLSSTQKRGIYQNQRSQKFDIWLDSTDQAQAVIGVKYRSKPDKYFNIPTGHVLVVGERTWWTKWEIRRDYVAEKDEKVKELNENADKDNQKKLKELEEKLNKAKDEEIERFNKKIKELEENFNKEKDKKRQEVNEEINKQKEEKLKEINSKSDNELKVKLNELDEKLRELEEKLNKEKEEKLREHKKKLIKDKEDKLKELEEKLNEEIEDNKNNKDKDEGDDDEENLEEFEEKIKELEEKQVGSTVYGCNCIVLNSYCCCVDKTKGYQNI